MYYVNKTVSSGERPQELEVTPTAVYVRRDVEEAVEEVNGKERTYFRYKESKYDKETYAELLANKSKALEKSSLTTMLALVEKDVEITKLKQENNQLKQTNLTALKAIAELDEKLHKLKE